MQDDFNWQLKYLSAVRNIVGPLLLEPAPMELDMREATDLLVLKARDLRIACRIRRAGYADTFPWDFTLRSRRDSGAATELSKITDGFGDWLFYGHAQHNEVPALSRWFLVDLAAWRAHMIRNRSDIKFEQKSNGDGTHFVCFDIRSFPPKPPICVASSHEIERLAA